MLGMDALFNSPRLVTTAAKAIGLEAARLDQDPEGTLWLSLKIHGRVQQAKIPTGKTFTLDEILALVFPPIGSVKDRLTRAPTPAEASAAVAPHASPP
jgi:hypothetical protein